MPLYPIFHGLTASAEQMFEAGGREKTAVPRFEPYRYIYINNKNPALCQYKAPIPRTGGFHYPAESPP